MSTRENYGTINLTGVFGPADCFRVPVSYRIEGRWIKEDVAEVEVSYSWYSPDGLLSGASFSQYYEDHPAGMPNPIIRSAWADIGMRLSDIAMGRPLSPQEQRSYFEDYRDRLNSRDSIEEEFEFEHEYSEKPILVRWEATFPRYGEEVCEVEMHFSATGWYPDQGEGADILFPYETSNFFEIAKSPEELRRYIDQAVPELFEESTPRPEEVWNVLPER